MTELAPELDLLTGAWKRSFFELQLARAVSHSHRHKMPLSLLYADVDDLQEHNDLHGPEAVDQLLAQVAERISEVVDGRGPIGRMEGGAFAIFLSGFAAEQALQLAEQIRLRLPQLISLDKHPLTASIGVASLRSSEPWGNLMEAAERACRKAKQGTRGTVAPR